MLLLGRVDQPCDEAMVSQCNLLADRTTRLLWRLAVASLTIPLPVFRQCVLVVAIGNDTAPAHVLKEAGYLRCGVMFLPQKAPENRGCPHPIELCPRERTMAALAA